MRGGRREEGKSKEILKRGDGEETSDLTHAFMDDCICIQTSQHALLCHSGTKSACSTQSAVAFYHLAAGQRVCKWVSDCICVCVCLHVCEFKRECAHTSVCVCVCVFMDIDLLTTLPLWFIFKQTAHPSPLLHLLFPIYPSVPSLSLLCSPPIHPSSKIPSLSLSNPPLLNPSLLPPILFLHPSLPVSIPPSAFTSRGVDNFLNPTEVERFQI